MKYGRLVHIGYADSSETSKREVNVGDILEGMALENIYNRMGIDKSQILNVYQHEIRKYDGEYVVLPINCYNHTVEYSDRIIPVFIGLTLGGQHDISIKEEKLLKRFSPVGCRDERTLRRLLDKGIDAYLNGCMVATFPQREQNLPTQNKVFFVDAQKKILEYAPKELFESYKFICHDMYITSDELTESPFKLGEEILNIYKNEARLVITSRFHAAVLCLALGIPCILTMENFYYKYTWIRKFIPVYDPSNFGEINWNPPIVTIPEEEKELMIKIACNRMKEVYQKYYPLCTLSELRETIEIKKFDDIFYGNYAIDYITKNWDKDTTIKYAYWGATNVAKKIEEYIRHNYPNAQLCRVYDLIVRNPFLDMVPRHPDTIGHDDSFFIFVTGQSVINAAKDKFNEMHKPESEFFLCERQFLTEKDIR